MDNHELVISAIKNGTVIDHIPNNLTLKVFRILDPKDGEAFTMGLNLESNRIGRKGIIKMSDRVLTDLELSKIALIAPEVTVNVIDNYKVASKVHLDVQSKLNDVIRCINPKCITNIEQTKTRFDLVQKDPIKVKCNYCERYMSKEDILVKID